MHETKIQVCNRVLWSKGINFRFRKSNRGHRAVSLFWQEEEPATGFTEMEYDDLPTNQEFEERLNHAVAQHLLAVQKKAG